MDFYRIAVNKTKSGVELSPDFIVRHSKDLMVRGKSFYAIWDEERGIWSQDEYDVARLVDAELEEAAKQIAEDIPISIKFMSNFSSNSWIKFKNYLKNVEDMYHPLNSKVVFANSEVKKSDYVSRRLPYPLTEGDYSAWDEMVSTLYAPSERAKIEWAIGSIISGDSKRIQKFFVFYGSGGTGKSTILNIIAQMFDGYTTVFDGKALGRTDSTFATEAFKNNPLVAIQHDGDLSRIEDNTRLNSIISHEDMIINEKYKSGYTAHVNALLFMGTNQPVKISDAKSGIIRRLVDIHPTGVTIPTNHYHTLLERINFELGAIAHHCLEVYHQLGRNYYNGYKPFEMMLQTDVFFNFIEAYYDVFKKQDYTYLAQAYKWYKEFCEETGIPHPLPQYKMREELRNYFDEFKERERIGEQQIRSYYKGFNADKFKAPVKDDSKVFSLVMEETESLLDEVLQHYPAQLAGEDENPAKKWANVKTTLSDIDTTQLHWVKVPENLICIDFDLKDLNGHKALERNLEAASAWPATYAELSKSGEGVHLHYYFGGPLEDLAPEFAPGIEVKKYQGNSSLRRKLIRCNNIEIAEISSGLPLKQKEAKVLTEKTIKSEKGLRQLIERNLKKEIHPGTKPSVDFIHHILEEAHESGMKYDVTDLRPRILAFANNSTHQSKTCLETVQQMKFSSTDDEEIEAEIIEDSGDPLVFFDVEVYSNLFVICWKYQGKDEVVRMVNPSAHEVSELFKLKLVGFYNRRYDNHILYAASMGYSTEKLFALSQKLIVDNNRNAPFAAAYGISYADIWDFSTKRQGLKQFEIDLGIHHLELDFPWDEPVAEENWPRVVEYCVNDVRATEAVFEDRKGDWVARQILAALSGLTVNDTTPRHTAKIIFGDDKNPQREFVYTDLSKEFPGYAFELGKSSYRGEDPGEGGYVYAEPGCYEHVAVLDVASMHPASMEALNLFGKYTERFRDLREARVAVKRKDYARAVSLLGDGVRELLDGAEADPSIGEALAYALKIAINTVYGLTSAKFDNPFRDKRNIDNIVAKRGALFMIDLKYQLQKGGHDVVHIKTDSVKIPNATDDVIEFIMEYGRKYGYDFEHEATYDEFILANDAVYVARKGDTWEAVGAQFQHPYVFKTLFSGEELTFRDYCEKRNVTKGTMYLDLVQSEVPDHRKMRHLGRTGSFVPVLEGGGVLYRFHEEKYFAVAGTKGHLWMEAELAKDVDDLKIDMAYFEKLKDAAETSIAQLKQED